MTKRAPRHLDDCLVNQCAPGCPRSSDEDRIWQAATFLLGALIDLTVYAEAGPEGVNGDVWIAQAMAAIDQAHAADIVAEGPGPR